ncbi:DNA repair exonuclease SbcCD ATPase subunit [Bradyrhizobium sp. USDA 4448]
MDIAAGLTLLGQATTIVKNLRDIDKGFDVAALKVQMADLYGTLADVKIALSDARETIHERDKKIKELEEKVSALSSGEVCPICSEGRMKVVSSHEHPTLGAVGILERTLKCEKCGHSEKHMHDPNGRLPKRK